MKKFSALAVLLLMAAGCTSIEAPFGGADIDDILGEADSRVDEPEPREPTADDLYDPARMPIYKITLEPAAEEQLAAQPRAYVAAGLELIDSFGSERVEVGLKLKGHGSFRTLEQKAAFRIKIDAIHERQTLRGLKALTLNNMTQDTSLMAERLSYHVFRAFGAPASRTNHALVYVNDTFFGIYANIETPNEEFLAGWFEDPHRNLYEQVSGRDFHRSTGIELLELETNEKQPDDRTKLHALREACIAFDLERARELVDWPQFLLFSALEAAVNQVDGYSYALNWPNNYRVYDSDTGFVFIPSGLDWATGRVKTQDGGLFIDPFWVRPSHGVLMRMCLADQLCTDEYSAVIEMVAGRWDELELEDHLNGWSAQIAESLLTDTRRESSVKRAIDNREVRRNFIRGRAQALRDAVSRRQAQN
jgi:hypothetical protein